MKKLYVFETENYRLISSELVLNVIFFKASNLQF